VNNTLEEITKLEAKLESSNVSLESSRNSLKEANSLKDSRKTLSVKISNLKKEIEVINNEQTRLHKIYDEIEKKYNNEKELLKELEKSFDEVDKHLKVCAADNQYLTDKLFFEQMKERKKIIDDARDKATSAEIVLDKISVDENALLKIDEAEKKLNEIKVRSNVNLPKLTIKGLSKTTIILNQEVLDIDEETKQIYNLDKNYEIEIPEYISCTISPGLSTDEILKDLEIAEIDLIKICKEYQVDNPQEARSSFEERQKAANQIEEKENIEITNLRDLSYEELDAKIRKLETTVPTYTKNRKSTTPLPSSTSESRKILEKTQAKYDKILKNKSSSESQHKTTSEKYYEIQGNMREIQIKLDLKKIELEGEETALSKQKEKITDEALELKISSLDKEVKEINSHVKSLIYVIELWCAA